MRNIIRAMNYQIRTDNFTLYAVLVGIGAFVLGLMDAPRGLIQITGGEYAASSAMGTMVMILPLCVMVLCTRICGWDQADKTINYEIMTGHSRNQVYFGRVIPSLIISVLLFYIILLLPLVFFTVKNGWGVNISFGGMALRLALMIFPLFRYCCFMILLTFLLRNCYTALIAGYFLTEIPSMFSILMDELLNVSVTWQLSVTNITSLVSFNSRMGFADGKDITVYDAGLSAEFVVLTIAVSLAVGFAALFLGNLYFRKHDLK